MNSADKGSHFLREVNTRRSTPKVTIVKICFMFHRKHTWSQLPKRSGSGASVLLSHPCHVSVATLFTLCTHESQKFYDHDRERKQNIKLKKKQQTTRDDKGRTWTE